MKFPVRCGLIVFGSFIKNQFQVQLNRAIPFRPENKIPGRLRRSEHLAALNTPARAMSMSSHYFFDNAQVQFENIHSTDRPMHSLADQAG